MAIKDFKNIIDRKGYLVETEDRKIFEKEISKSNFGLGCSDMIEFILYDSNDNQLPQGDSGKLARYINIDDANIKDYFILTESLETTKKNGTSEFIVDIEKLVREAGYSNGIFKTQVTLLNRRAGVDSLDGNNLWIHEISPSRTEIRVLPNRSTKLNTDLEKRYLNFVDGQTFRDDVIYYITDYVNNLDFEKIFSNFKSIKGKITDGENYIKLIQKEFKIENFEILINRVRSKVIESMTYYSQNRNWKISDINYGKPIKDKSSCITLSISELQRDIEQSIISCIDFYLPKRDIQENNILTKEQQITIDKLKSILKTTTSESIYDTTEPDEIIGDVYGCTDPTSLNYNPNANINDGSCKYESISGCTDPTSLNYNPLATIDDGSCKYEDISSVNKIYYVWSSEGTINYVDENGVSQSKFGVEYESIKIRYQKDTITFDGDIREYPKLRPIENIYKQYLVTNLFVADDNDYKGFGQANRVQVSFMNDSDRLALSDEIGPGDSTQFCAQKDSVIPPLGWLGRNIKIVELGDCGASDIPIGGGGSNLDIKYDSVESGQELTTVYGTGPNGEVTSEEIVIDTRNYK